MRRALRPGDALFLGTDLVKPERSLLLAYDDPLERVIRRIQTVRAPVIAMIEGGVYGGACDVALTCDLAVGCPTASFSMSPAKMGVPYNSAGILHFINVVGARVARVAGRLWPVLSG